MWWWTYVIQEIVVLVEVLVLEKRTSDDLVGELAAQIDHVLQHLIVRLSGEHDSASV